MKKDKKKKRNQIPIIKKSKKEKDFTINKKKIENP
jgi:hypothetical protein